MVDDFNLAAQARHPHRVRPDTLAAANGYWQDGRSGFQSDSHRARFEPAQRTVRIAPATLGKHHDRAAVPQPLERALNRSGIALFQLQWPGAQPPHRFTHDRPAERFIPCQKPHGPFNWSANPEWIDVSLMVGGDYQTAFRWNVFSSGPARSEERRVGTECRS